MAGSSAWPRPIGARAAAGGAQARPDRARANILATELTVQIFGFRDSRSTQKAQRFFKERRVNASFVDLARRPIAPTELRRFTERFGASALVDSDSREYRDAGLQWQRIGDDDWLARLIAQPRLIRLPLVRAGKRLAVGDDENGWREIVSIT